MIIGILLGAWLYSQGGRRSALIGFSTACLIEAINLGLVIYTGKSMIGWVLR